MKLFFKKKAITGYPRSFAKRLTWRIMLRMIIIMIIPVLLLFWITYGIVALGVTGISDRILKGEKEEVRRIYEGYVKTHHDVCLAFIQLVRSGADDVLHSPDAQSEDVERVVYSAAIVSGFSKLLTEKMVHLEGETVDSQQESKEKKRK